MGIGGLNREDDEDETEADSDEGEAAAQEVTSVALIAGSTDASARLWNKAFSIRVTRVFLDEGW